jgi:hypothetical protein
MQYQIIHYDDSRASALVRVASDGEDIETAEVFNISIQNLTDIPSLETQIYNAYSSAYFAKQLTVYSTVTDYVSTITGTVVYFGPPAPIPDNPDVVHNPISNAVNTATITPVQVL